ncbi:protoheme IX farnesyltransferase [bacterium]|nr:protoheme IX farnesyltransferase [bacterium]
MNSTNQVYNNTAQLGLKAKLSDYSQLFKLRLTSLVVFSTFVGYTVSAGADANWFLLIPLLVGGFLTVASANSLNQVIERNTDRLMTRTLNRPVATGRMSVNEALVASVASGLIGVLLIGYFLNPLSALLAFAGLVIYAFMYTPLKQINGVSVWVGAVAGAVPPLVGIAAASGSIGAFGWYLFVVQFFWQFPHFYAIAWLLDEDYKKAGLKLMPIGGKRDKASAWQIMILTTVLIPSALIPAMYGVTSWVSAVVAALAGVYLLTKAIKLFKSLDNTDAKALMFASFAYLPIILITYLIEFTLK